jgi:rSAM/selenodomain-associated transferase 1
MSSRNKRCLQVFAREPRAGEVKTRLIPAIGPEGARAVYCRLLEDTLQQAARADVDCRELWVDREPQFDYVAQLAERFALMMRVQLQAGLGDRMADAIAAGLSHSDKVVLIGSDCPELSPDYLNAAFDSLETHDAVFGPTADGGYILIGLKEDEPELLSGVNWSAAGVMQQHRDYLHRTGKSCAELPVRQDVDTPEDLQRFRQLMPETPRRGNTV